MTKQLTPEQKKWIKTRDDLISEIERLGFPAELGYECAKNLGGVKAMERMMAYLRYVKPRKAELVVDEMLAICSEINAWREKKASEEASEAYNEWLESDLRNDGEDSDI